MTNPNADRPALEDAIDIPLWLEADRDAPLATRAARDREIARHLGAADDVARVRSWWASLRPGDGLGATLVHGRRLVSAALVVLGLVAGSGVAAAALHYDGTTPVNVVRALGLLVGLQLIVLSLTLALLPGGRFGLGALQRSLVAFNPAGIAAAVYRRFASLPEAVERLFVWHAGRSAANRFAKWQVLLWAQLAAVSFNVGVLVTSFALVAATDLAFGWSTTLDLSPRDAAAVTNAVAAPWSAWLPAAVPSDALIEGSRVFRLEHAAAAPRAAEAFTGWWPFLLASIVTYGLLPRLLLGLVALLKLRAATRRLLLDDAHVTALLDRMQSPSLHLRAQTPERARETVGEVPAAAGPLEGGTAAAVVWGDSVDAGIVEGAVIELLSARLASAPFPAGGGASLEHDREAVERVGALEPRHVVVFTRAYEPPLLDLLDFIGLLRRRLGDSAAVIVCPCPEPGRAVTAAQLDAWRRTLATLRDPKLYVEVAV